MADLKTQPVTTTDAYTENAHEALFRIACLASTTLEILKLSDAGAQAVGVCNSAAEHLVGQIGLIADSMAPLYPGQHGHPMFFNGAAQWLNCKSLDAAASPRRVDAANQAQA